MIRERNKFRQLESKDICQIYELLHKEGLVSFPLTKEAQNKLSSLVASVNGVYFGHDIYKTPEERTVAYLYLMIKDHPFIDGNKRTAVITFDVLATINRLNPSYKDFSLDELAVYIESIQEEDHQLVISTIARVLFKSAIEVIASEYI